MTTRMPEKTFQKKMFRSHLLTRMTGNIELGIVETPDWWDAVQEHPMISIPRKKLDKKAMSLPDDHLLKIISKREPHLDDEPHALASGLSKYYKHPKQIFLERWKHWMAKGLDQETAYTNVLLERFHDSTQQVIEYEEQTRQAHSFGVPAPDIPEQLDAIDRDMKQAMHPGIVNLNRKRYAALAYVAQLKLERMNALQDADDIGPLPYPPSEQEGHDLARLFDEPNAAHANKRASSSSSSSSFTSSSSSSSSSSLNPEASGEQDEQPSGGDEKQVEEDPDFLAADLNIQHMLKNAHPLSLHEVRQILPDSQWLDFKRSHPELRRAFDEILWSSDPDFAEQYERMQLAADVQLSGPAAGPLRRQERDHNLQMAATAPYLGFTPTGQPADPSASQDVQTVSQLIDLVKMVAPYGIGAGQHVPQPSDRVKYSDVDLQQTVSSTKAQGRPAKDASQLSSGDFIADAEAAKSHIVSQLESLRSHMIADEKLTEDAFLKMQKIRPHDPPSPKK